MGCLIAYSDVLISLVYKSETDIITLHILLKTKT